jgi:hypothetical protein
LGSNVAVCSACAVVRLPVKLHIPLAGSYSSALLKALALPIPRATSSTPVSSNVLVTFACKVEAGGGVPVLRAAAFWSAVLRLALSPSPPATSTSPLGNNVAVCLARALLRLEAAIQVPLAGSYSSALLKGLAPPNPPATSNAPLGSNVAVCS